MVLGAAARARSRGTLGAAALAAAILVGVPTSAAATAVKDNLYGVKAMSPREAWMVGNFGAILRTTDGGRSWERRQSGTRSPLFAIDFGDARHGWVVGKASLVLATADGGETWAPQESPIGGDKPLFGVDAVDASTVWAVGDWGAIAATRDGGITWEDRSIPDDVVLYDVSFADAQHGFIAGEFGTLLATADGGRTWEKKPVGVDKTLFGLHFTTAEEGWVVGMDGLILHTLDGGATWAVQHGSTGEGNLEDLGFMETLRNPGFYDVDVVGRYGVVVGDTGLLLTTSDGGFSWTPQALPEEKRLVWMRAVSLAPGAEGFVVGARGFAAAVARDRVLLDGAGSPPVVP